MTDRVIEKLKPDIQLMINVLKEELLAVIQPIDDKLTAFSEKINKLEGKAKKALEIAEENTIALCADFSSICTLHQQRRVATPAPRLLVANGSL